MKIKYKLKQEEIVIHVNSIGMLKKTALKLVPSIKYRKSKIVFMEKETNYCYSPGISWVELWQQNNNDDVIFNNEDPSSPGYVPMHRDFLMITGIVKTKKGLRVIVQNF